MIFASGDKENMIHRWERPRCTDLFFPLGILVKAAGRHVQLTSLQLAYDLTFRSLVVVDLQPVIGGEFFYQIDLLPSPFTVLLHHEWRIHDHTDL